MSTSVEQQQSIVSSHEKVHSPQRSTQYLTIELSFVLPNLGTLCVGQQKHQCKYHGQCPTCTYISRTALVTKSMSRAYVKPHIQAASKYKTIPLQYDHSCYV